MSNPIQFRANDKDFQNWLRIKDYIFKKHGKLHSVIAKEAINLMLLGLEQVPCVRAHRLSVKTKNRYHKLLFFLIEENSKQINDIQIEEYIINNFGSTKRTINNYMKILLEREAIFFIRKTKDYTQYKINMKKIIRELRYYSDTINNYDMNKNKK